MSRRRLVSWVLGGLLLAASPLLGIPSWTLALATLVACTSLSLIGLNLVYGMTGMLSLGHAAFAVWPIYIAGILHGTGLNWFMSVPIGLLVATLIAYMLGTIFIKLPGIFFAIGTLGFSFVTEGLARAFPSLTGGASGLVLVPPFQLTAWQWYALSLVSLGLGLAAYARITSGASSRALRIIRHDELSAEVLGVDVARVKRRLFVIGTLYAGVSGVLAAFYVGIVVPEHGGVNMSLSSLATVIIGGAGSLLGPLAGSFAVQWLFAVAGAAHQYELIIYGACFFVIVLFAPKGLCGLLDGWLQSRRSRRRASVETRNAAAASRHPAVDPPAAAAAAAAEGICLEVRLLSKRFGGILAVDQVSLNVRHGQIVALLGPNGAGKSTLFNLINGIERRDEGTVTVQGLDMLGLPIHRLAAYAGRSFQTPRLVPDMTVLDNVAIRLDNLQGTTSEKGTRERAHRQLMEYGLEKYADMVVSQVGIGLHKLIDIARASIGSPPLLLLDEPAVGLTEDEVQHLATMLNKLKAGGTAILLVEHNFEFVKRVADQVVVLNGGKVLTSGHLDHVRSDLRVQEAYFGALE